MICGKDLHTLLPQSDPILMIDCLISSDQDTSITTLFIKEDNIFVNGAKLSEAGIIENIAQTAAARSAWEAKESNIPVRTGFIGSVKKLKIHFLPKIGQTIKTIININTVIGDITVISAESFIDETLLAECEMTIILTDSPKNL